MWRRIIRVVVAIAIVIWVVQSLLAAERASGAAGNDAGPALADDHRDLPHADAKPAGRSR
ncbi:MAG: hypothetical protein PHY45_15230 [Rhodocyclaceae bacterium]|nr:hypothetical protein [Rhodocyclaceae bacterium]